MRVKTSVTLSEETLRALDKAAVAARDARDLEILNRSAERLNREGRDVLEYQADE